MKNVNLYLRLPGMRQIKSAYWAGLICLGVALSVAMTKAALPSLHTTESDYVTTTAFAPSDSLLDNGDLFISEYVEGTSTSKALEVFNPTKRTIDVSTYQLHLFRNGGITAGAITNLTGTLAPGKTIVVCNTGSASATIGKCNLTGSAMNFTGDDAIALINSATKDTLDIIGVIGQDPGDSWAVDSGATQDFTLVRKPNITKGQLDWTVGVTEWIVRPVNTFDSLGDHTFLPPLNINTCTASAGTLKANSINCLDEIGGVVPTALSPVVTLSALPNGDAVIPEGYSRIFVLTSGKDLVIEDVNPEPSFSVVDTGRFTIHTLVFDADSSSENFLDLSIVTPGQTTGADVLSVITRDSLCASLDVAGAVFMVELCPEDTVCTANAGTLRDNAFDCIKDSSTTISATPTGGLVVPDGYKRVFILSSGKNLLSKAISDSASFAVSDTGRFTIHTFVYNTDSSNKNFFDISTVVLGSTTATQIRSSLIERGTCASLDIIGAPFDVTLCPDSTVCTANAGTLTANAFDCIKDSTTTISATPKGDIVVPAGYSSIFVLTSGSNLVIEAVSDTPFFAIADTGRFTIHTLVFSADTASPDFLDLSIVKLGETTGGNVLGLVTANKLCASLDVAGAAFDVTLCPDSTVCTANAGTLTANSFDCIKDSTTTISATPKGDIVVPAGYSSIFVLTSGSNLVIEAVSDTPFFAIADTGRFTIHTLVFSADTASPDFLDLSIVKLGETTGGNVLGLVTANKLCASLDVAGAAFDVTLCPDSTVCTANAGTLTANTFDCIKDSTTTISATPKGDIVVPTGYSSIFVLTSGSNLVIEAVSDTPFFAIADTGRFTIHTLVFSADTASPDFLDLSIVKFGETTGVDVLGLVTANKICASLDVAGAAFDVTLCPDSTVCTANAGTLTANSFDCIKDSTTTISATPKGDIVVPAGYSSIFVLTSGSNLVIEAVSDTPFFAIADTGRFTIHTLVFSADTASPDFLDLSIVKFGETTGVDVLGLVTANKICASLDVAGAAFDVTLCPDSTVCTANAGTLTANAFDCIKDSTTTISATPKGDIVVPAGYSSIFVLTSGSNLVIEAVSDTPFFAIADTGRFTIHTLVFSADTASPDFLDLSVVKLGETTGGDVLGLVTANKICASLDVAGAAFDVTLCPDSTVCTANAGTLTANAFDCIKDSTTTISATPKGDIVVPAGYSSIFVLTSGSNLVIEAVSDTPVFTVNAAGRYTIHTLVYNADSTSPDFLDLGIVKFGETTGVDVLGLVADNKICASLDAEGAPFAVVKCTEEENDKQSCTIAGYTRERDGQRVTINSVYIYDSPADPGLQQGTYTEFQRFTFRNNAGSFTNYGDSAIITGRLINNVDSTIQFDVFMKLIQPHNWTEWSAKGRTFMAEDPGAKAVAATEFVNWTYWVLDGSSSKLTGRGSINGDVLTLGHVPADTTKGFQVGLGANDKNGLFGIGGWFSYKGTIKGREYFAAGDINAELTDCRTDSAKLITVPQVVNNRMDVRIVTPQSIRIMWKETYSKVDIERSEDGRNFNKVGSVNNGNEFMDNTQGGQVFFYRLRATDAKGKTTLSQVINIDVNATGFDIYPNPASGDLFVRAISPIDGAHSVKLFDLNGKLVMTQKVLDLSSQIRFDVSSLKKGVYVLQIVQPNGKNTIKRIAVQ